MLGLELGEEFAGGSSTPRTDAVQSPANAFARVGGGDVEETLVGGSRSLYRQDHRARLLFVNGSKNSAERPAERSQRLLLLDSNVWRCGLQGVYLLSAVRTPIGKFGGAMASLTAADMGVVAAKAAMQRAGIEPTQVDEAIFGNARQAGGGANPARQISVRSGVPQEVPAYTVNKACASGMKSIALAYQAILLGDANCILAGGTESMSRVPYYLDGARWGYRLGNQEMVDGMYRDGFFCPLAKMVMGETGEVLVEQYKITRDEQDEFALLSQTRAARASAAGRFDAEIVPVTIEGKKGTTNLARDEHPFPDASMEKLAKLAPVFSKSGQSTGTITAGNSSGITDGAAAVIVAGEQFVKRNNLKPLARIVAVTSAGVDPRTMGIGPVPALRKLEDRHNLRLHEFGLVELNEAFAAQVLACDRTLNFNRDRLNVNGGAIALGHPIGCTGTRIIVTLLHEMLKRNTRRGVATLCVSGGLGMALALENVA
jgi:acetyl-CoA C-acetyltransferase